MAFSTSKSLLSRIKQGDEIGWCDFYKTYRPLIILRGRDFRLSETEIDELIQETVIAVFRGREKFKYDPSKGKYRNYLRRVIDHRAIDIIRKRKPEINSPAEGLDLLMDEKQSHIEEKWDTEWQEHIIKLSLDELKDKIESVTYQAFELYAIDGWAPAKVAEFLDISTSSVYVAKNRAVEALRKIISENEEI